ncbi:MAG: Elongation factor G [Deltaproteobacteria bacterium ADurb.Bin510]|nr:MAG: Elongation factor G [Deltaproteobacteria bacterium ADurb.Bin510]
MLSDIKEQLEIKPLPLTLPIGSEDNLSGVVDVLRKQALIYKKDGSGEFTLGPVPPEMETEVENTYLQMIEDLAETDDDLMEKYLEGAELSQEELRLALRNGLKQGLFVPVFTGAGLINLGIQPLMDFMAETMLMPGETALPDLVDEAGQRKPIRPDDTAPFLGYVFKTMSDPYTGTLSIIRCLAGTLSPDASVFNTGRGVRERIGALLCLEGKNQKPLDQVGPGDIFAVAKLKETKTGDTLSAEDLKLSLPKPHFPEAILGMAVTPKTKADVDKILPAIQKLMDEDPVLRVHRDEQTGEFILSGLGQLHIEITVDRLKRRYGVAVDLKPPKVPYKETITASAKVQGRHKKQTGGHGQYGDCWIEVQPLPRGSGFQFVDQIVGGAIPRNYIPAVEKGIIEAMQEGPLTGNPMVDLKVILFDGSYHDVDSSEMAFKIAGALAFRKAMESCRPILLEPIVELVVTVPEDAMGEVMGDLNGRRGKIEGMLAKGRYQELKAQVPLAEILTYASELTSMTSGRGSFAMQFSHMEQVPYNLQERLIKEGQNLKDAQQ